MQTMIASDDSGPCLGIELNIWERAKVKWFRFSSLMV
jgi:hypothetical protein